MWGLQRGEFYFGGPIARIHIIVGSTTGPLFLYSKLKFSSMDTVQYEQGPQYVPKVSAKFKGSLQKIFQKATTVLANNSTPRVPL